MPVYPYRELHPTAEAEELYRRWISYLDEEFTKHKKPALRAEIVRDNLHQLYLGRPHGGKLNFTLTSELRSQSPATAPRRLQAQARYGISAR